VERDAPGPDRAFLEQLKAQSTQVYLDAERAQAERKGHWIMRSLKWLAPASAACVVAGIVLFITLGEPGARVAWADVQKQMCQERTVRFKMTVSVPGKTTDVLECMVKEPSRSRVEIEDGLVYIMDYDVGILLLDPAKRIATSLSGDKAPNLVSMPKSIIDELKKLGADASAEFLGTERMDGRDVDKLLLRLGHNDTATIWADPDTQLPVRIEFDAVYRDWACHGVYENIEFGVDLDDSLFSMALPDGYTESHVDSPLLPQQGSFAEAQTRAYRAMSMANLHMLEGAGRKYADENNGQWPESLEELVGRDHISRRTLVNPARKDLAVGYVYIRPHERSPEPKALLMYEAHEAWGKGISVAFTDGRVEFLEDEAEFKQLLAASKGKPEPQE
jgi:outer membrane lipoprotein-sorting protein